MLSWFTTGFLQSIYVPTDTLSIGYSLPCLLLYFTILRCTVLTYAFCAILHFAMLLLWETFIRVGPPTAGKFLV